MRSFFELEALELRRLLSSTIESIDGSGNNLAHPTWGPAGVDLIRLAQAGYSDGISSPNLASDQSARAISNILNSQADPKNPTQDIATVDQNSLSDFGYAFGQFMDHDMDLTPDGGAAFDIPVAANDPIGPMPLSFTRSKTDPATGTSKTNPLQQVTTVTAYFDLSQVYGSSAIVADALRAHKGGLLKTSPGDMLPYDNTNYFTTAQIAALNMANDAHAVPQDQLFAAGDVRANENLELTVLQTLFLRNHNAIATQLGKSHPTWTDDQLYQEARKLNIAQYQAIVYNEWIPAVIGQNWTPPYHGYNPNANATIANEFSTVAFRMGHSMVSADIERQGNNGQEVEDGVSLAFDFFDPNLLSSTPKVDPLTGKMSTDIDAVLKGEADANGQADDMMAVNDVRNLLFGNGGFGGEDLIARDVQRDRDNGIPDYNALRVALGLPAVTSFAQITHNSSVQKELAQAYPGGVNTIDAFEGGLAEDHVRGSDVGPLFQRILANQFTRLRDGDRFFYLNESLNPQERAILSQDNTLSKVISNNTDIHNLQANAMYFRASVAGKVVSATNGAALPGIKLQLKNDDGNIVATTTTDSLGHYTFTEYTKGAATAYITPGLSSTGAYTITIVPPTKTQNASAPKTIQITRGDTNITNINFTLSAPTTGTRPPLPPPTRPPLPPINLNPDQTLAAQRDPLDDLLT